MEDNQIIDDEIGKDVFDCIERGLSRCEGLGIKFSTYVEGFVGLYISALEVITKRLEDS